MDYCLCGVSALVLPVAVWVYFLLSPASQFSFHFSTKSINGCENLFTGYEWFFLIIVILFFKGCSVTDWHHIRGLFLSCSKLWSCNKAIARLTRKNRLINIFKNNVTSLKKKNKSMSCEAHTPTHTIPCPCLIIFTFSLVFHQNGLPFDIFPSSEPATWMIWLI